MSVSAFVTRGSAAAAIGCMSALLLPAAGGRPAARCPNCGRLDASGGEPSVRCRARRPIRAARGRAAAAAPGWVGAAQPHQVFHYRLSDQVSADTGRGHDDCRHGLAHWGVPSRAADIALDPRYEQDYDLHVLRGTRSMDLHSMLVLRDDAGHFIRADAAQLPPDVSGIGFFGLFAAPLRGRLSIGRRRARE